MYLAPQCHAQIVDDPPYQLIISGTHLAEMDDFLLLRQAQARKPFMPLVVSASSVQKESARLALERGACDVISHPLGHEQTVRTIRLALWHTKLKGLFARKEAALAHYFQHLAELPRGQAEGKRSVLQNHR